MKKSFEAVIKIVAVFTVFSLLFSLGGCFDEKQAERDGEWADTGFKNSFEQTDLKAVWISYIEFQSVDFSSKDSFTEDMDKIFENCKNMGLNTVIVHVRSFGDAFYKSDYFPYSHIMTGTQGQNPGFDPLEIMVNLAHGKGLRIEAWVNPYRVKLYSHPQRLSSDNPAQNSSLTITTDSGIYYNPALQQVRDLVVSGVVEIVENYEVDGIHFDDYFYPSTDEFIDAKEYAEYQGDLPLEDWRRENVNKLIRQVYSAIKAVDETVSFGISPQGNDDNNYNMQYSDVALWLSEEGYCDYIMPQIYWGFDYRTPSGSGRYSFKNLSYEWSQYKKADGVKLYVGLGAYRIGDGDGGSRSDEWRNGDNLMKMIQVVNANPRLDGWSVYSYNSLFADDEYGTIRKSEVENITELNKNSNGIN